MDNQQTESHGSEYLKGYRSGYSAGLRRAGEIFNHVFKTDIPKDSAAIIERGLGGLFYSKERK